MSDDKRPDYGDLLASPYEDDDAREGESSIPWKPPVIAAIVGALAVSAFVLYAIVVGPGASEEDGTSSTTQAPVASSELPPGFVAVTDSVGASVLTVDRQDGVARFVVGTAVAGGEDPERVAPLDVAAWSIAQDGDPVWMRRQYGDVGAIGVTTIEFDAARVPEEGSLVAFTVSGIETQTVTLSLPAALPSTDSGQVVVGDATVVFDVTVGNGWGYVVWQVRGAEWPAKVDALVTFEGTDDPRTDTQDPTRLLPRHLAPPAPGISPAQPAPLYNFAGEEQLLRVGEPLGGSNEPSGVTVEIRVTVPEVGETAEVPFG